MLATAGPVVLSHFVQRARWRLFPSTPVRKVDLADWQPPDTAAAREAEEHSRDVSTPEMFNHSQRTYYFSGVMYELSDEGRPIDKEVLYVAAMMHDVGLFEDPRPEDEHCFSVGGARAGRHIATNCGWAQARQDQMAVAITTNLNARVPIEDFGVEAHFMRAGGLVEVIAQEWKVHPDNASEILSRFPRQGFAEDAIEHIKREGRTNPSCRFAVLDPIFPMLLSHSKFSMEAISK